MHPHTNAYECIPRFKLMLNALLKMLIKCTLSKIRLVCCLQEDGQTLAIWEINLSICVSTYDENTLGAITFNKHSYDFCQSKMKRFWSNTHVITHMIFVLIHTFFFTNFLRCAEITLLVNIPYAPCMNTFYCRCHTYITSTTLEISGNVIKPDKP